MGGPVNRRSVGAGLPAIMRNRAGGAAIGGHVGAGLPAKDRGQGRSYTMVDVGAGLPAKDRGQARSYKRDRGQCRGQGRSYNRGRGPFYGGWGGGMSLVELLTAVAVTSVVMVFVYGAFMGQRRLYGEEQQILELQQNVRMALDAVAHTLQQAGYWRCVDPHEIGRESAGVKNALRDPGSLFHTHPITGFNNVSADSDPLPDRQTRQGSDVLSYSFAAPNFQGPLAQDQNAATDPLRLVKNNSTSGLKKGQIVFITSCRLSALFQVTGVSLSGAEVTVEHDAGFGVPGNGTRCLQCDDGTSNCVDESDCRNPGGGFRKSGTFVHPVKVGYFRVNTKGEFQWIEGGPGGGVEFVFSYPRTLAENVEDFQVELGVDLSPVPDGSVEGWVSPEAVPDRMPEDGFPDWHRVTAVRCHLLARTQRTFKKYVDTQTYRFADRDVPAAEDGYRRVHMTKTVILRNAVP